MYKKGCEQALIDVGIVKQANPLLDSLKNVSRGAHSAGKRYMDLLKGTSAKNKAREADEAFMSFISPGPGDVYQRSRNYEDAANAAVAEALKSRGTRAATGVGAAGAGYGAYKGLTSEE